MTEHPDIEAIREADRARQAGQLLSDFLGGAPSYPPEGTDPDLAGAVGPKVAVPVFLDALARIYRLRRWGIPSFTRAYLHGALVSWKPGTRVRRDGELLRVTSPVCPIAGAAEADPKRCAGCQAFHEEVARQTLGSAFAAAWFERTIVHGDSDCAFVVRLRPREAA